MTEQQPLEFLSASDKAMISKCLEGNRLAQRELYELYADAMYTLAYRILGNFEEAEEALQDGFLAVFKGLASFKMESTLGAWIKTIIVRTAIRQLKKREKDLDIDTNISVELAPYVPDVWNDGGGNPKRDMEKVERAILSMPLGYRTVLILIEVEGWTHKETAEVLEISEGTTKSQLFHAKNYLRKLLVNP